MSTAPEPEREASSRARVPAPALAHIHAHTHARDVRVRVREISFSVSFSLRGCGGFSFFFISFFVHNSRAAMRRGAAPNPGLRWGYFWLLFGLCITQEQCRPRRHCNVAHDDTAMSPRTTQQCRPGRHQPKYKSNRNTEPKGGWVGVGFGLCFKGCAQKFGVLCYNAPLIAR